MARDVHWELVCSEKSRPFAIETFRLKVPNGWLYCNTITRARALRVCPKTSVRITKLSEHEPD
jgi:hypothetical protein